MAQRSLPSVVVLGGINMDLVTLTPRFAEPGETVVGTRFLTYPGGKGANQAVAAARIGAAIATVARSEGLASQFDQSSWSYKAAYLVTVRVTCWLCSSA